MGHYCTDCNGTGAADNGYECGGCWGAGWVNTPPPAEALALDELETSNEQRAKSAALLDMISSGAVKVA